MSSFLTGLFVPAVVETISRYPNNLGYANWIFLKNGFLMIFSVLALIAGSYISINDIIKIYTEWVQWIRGKKWKISQCQQKVFEKYVQTFYSWSIVESNIF